MAREEPKDVNIYFVKGYTKCHVVLLALDKRTMYHIPENSQPQKLGLGFST